MDYVEDDLRSEFVFNNPNSKVETIIIYKNFINFPNLDIYKFAIFFHKKSQII
jgi:hypothetical protein